MKRETTARRQRYYHGMRAKPEYIVWMGMRERVQNPNAANYCHYGGRGIAICDSWDDFGRFLEDMGSRPSPDHSLERLDTNGNYEPSNCRWATRSEQGINRRKYPNMTSRYIGVSRVASGRWAAYVTKDQKRICIGTFIDEEEAGWMRDQWVIALFGNSAPTNFDYATIQANITNKEES